MKILLTKSFFDSDIEYIESRLLPGIELDEPKNFEESTIADSAVDADVLMGGLVSEPVLKAAKKLKFIQIPWTGVNNLDFDLIEKYGVTVCNSHSNSSIVAEHAIALMMDAAKKITYHDRLMREGNWNRPGLNDNAISPFSKKISNANIAIIGFGSIGKDIYRMMKGFNSQFKVFNRSGNIDESINEGNISYHSIDTVYKEIKNIDFVFVALPLTDATEEIIDAKFIQSMNREAVLINVSRGEIIEEQALYRALRNRDIAGAAIDTWFNYPDKENPRALPSLRYKFHELDNMVMSPHRAGFIDSGFPHLDDAIENLNRAVKGKPLINIVSTEDKY